MLYIKTVSVIMILQFRFRILLTEIRIFLKILQKNTDLALAIFFRDSPKFPRHVARSLSETDGYFSTTAVTSLRADLNECGSLYTHITGYKNLKIPFNACSGKSVNIKSHCHQMQIIIK